MKNENDKERKIGFKIILTLSVIKKDINETIKKGNLFLKRKNIYQIIGLREFKNGLPNSKHSIKKCQGCL